MSEVKILHCADAHIGSVESFLGAKSKLRQAETLRTFIKTVELAVKEDVKLFLIAGDLFDSNTVEYTYINGVLDAIKSAPAVRFIYSAGNHDPYDINSPFKKAVLPGNLFIFDTKDSVFTFDDIGVKVYGRSFKEVYDKGEAEFCLPADESYINIMCIHGELTSDGSSDYNPISRSFIEKSGMDYIALGHIHKCTDIGNIGGTAFAYSGCLEGRGFDETGKKGVLTGTVSKGKTDLRFVPVSLRSHHAEKIDVSEAETNTEAAEKILSTLNELHGESFADNLYKITLTGEVAENTLSSAEITAVLNERLFFVKLKDKTSPAVNLELLAGEPSLKGIFVSKMLERIKNADGNEAQLLKSALYLGLKSFSAEVKYDED